MYNIKVNFFSEKIVLAYREPEHFDVLPEGWVEVTHTSGLPIYLHKDSRVCTFSRPYFIGPGSVRHHQVPVSAIPCLHQKRLIKEIEKNAAASANAVESLDAKALHEYASKIFRFKKIQVFQLLIIVSIISIKLIIFYFKFILALPSHVKLITVPSMETNMKPQHKGFFLNPHGKTSVGILHEYVQKVLKSTIDYVFSETRHVFSFSRLIFLFFLISIHSRKFF
ncbi:unnamed protein product [Dracunculus medinensis]|uniref:WW domain-containing protein n=1 Tax=Dracunculus medinensis TaxID=318479 RepID=A0A0N4U5L4_DRAME|nr:unnamed protein product [Dracunculus medinensis]